MRKRHIILIALLALFQINKTTGQNINGDTVFVSTENQTWLTFYAAPNGQVTKDASSFTVSGTGKSISIQPLKPNTRTTTLMVQEGPRTHQFLVFYKDDLNPLETSYDFTDLKKMAQKIKEKESQKNVAQVTPVKTTPAADTKKATTDSRSGTSGVSQSSIDLALAISAGDDAFDKGKYAEAKESYQKALQLKSNNDYSKTRIAAIDKLLADKEKLAKKLQDDNYNNALLKAAKAFTAKNYDEAKSSYKDALDSRPNDVFAANQITAIDKILADEATKAKQEETRRQQEETYQTTIVNADKAFVAQDFETAKSYYLLAASYKSGDPYPKKKLDDIEKKMSALSKEKEIQQKEASYQMTLTKAKSAFEAKNYDMSKELYNEALSIKPGDDAVKNQLKAIDKALSSQAKKEADDKKAAQAESDFNEAMTLADNAFKAENYDVARSEYNRALKYKKDSRAENQLKEITGITDKAKEKELGEKEKKNKEAARDNSYNLAIKNAQAFYNNKDYANAKIAYKQALNYKDEQEPKDKLAEIETLLSEAETRANADKEKRAQDEQLNKSYTAALAKAKVLEASNDYENAKLAYLEALQIKPAELTPKTRIEAIDKKVTEIETDKKYDAAISKGNIAIGDRQYPAALESFREALKLKPLESYPLKQMNYVQTMLAKDSVAVVDKTVKAEKTAGEDERIKHFNDAMASYKRADTALNQRRWQDALGEYDNFLRLMPDAKELNNYQFNTAGTIEYAKRKVVDLKNYLNRLKGSTYQSDAVPYSADDLKKKYPDVDFSATPQSLPNLSDSLAIFTSTGKDVLSETPRLTLADSSNSVRLTCLGISKKSGYVYLKLRIFNGGAEDFLTGGMHLSIARKKKPVQLDPAFVSSYPLVLPGKEFSFVYATRDYTVADTENLTLELNDRMKKTTIKLSIPGSTFNQEKSR